ncbi:hypothetical protein Amsp01_089410 [Amycolatopsis sp. NBRC 101858]|nr:hypothetical protein Amsp01_089410 [Amycolatopsis sp. NBRC 101858]
MWTEHIVRGPGKVLPASVQSLLIKPRNTESLARLADLSTGKHTRAKSGHSGP